MESGAREEKEGGEGEADRRLKSVLFDTAFIHR